MGIPRQGRGHAFDPGLGRSTFCRATKSPYATATEAHGPRGTSSTARAAAAVKPALSGEEPPPHAPLLQLKKPKRAATKTEKKKQF